MLVQTEVGRTWLRRVPGPATAGSWRGAITVGRWVGDQTAHLYVKAFDRAGARRVYGRKALRARWLPERVRGPREKRSAGAGVTTEAVLPAAVDLQAGDVAVPVRLHVRDASSGAATVSAYFTTRGGSQRGGPATALRRVTGTAHDGWWEGTVRFTHCQAFSDHWMLGARAIDVRGAIQQPAFADRVIEVQGTDHTVELPIVGSPVSWTDPARLRLTFAEDMVGITATSAPLWRTDFRPVYRRVPVSGTWSCADAAGGVVDCVAGPVRTAVVTLADPHLPRSTYSTVLGPEHLLDVRDLAGNPVRQARGLPGAGGLGQLVRTSQS